MKKAVLENTALAFFGIVAALLMLELGARLLPSRFLPASLRSIVEEREARLHANEPYIPDSKLWYVIKPGTDFIFKHPDQDFRMKTNLNFPGAGFRGGTLGGPPWGVAVGDSFTFGLGVNQEATWIARLAQLSHRDIINLGVPGWGPQQYTRTLERYGFPLKPKIVFYGLFSNDVGNVTRFAKDDGHFNRFSLREYLRLNSVTFNLFRRLRRAKIAVKDIELADVGLHFSSESLKSRVSSDSRRFSQGWPLTTQQIETAYSDSQRANATFVLLYFPSKEEVYWKAIKEKSKSLEPLDDRIDQLRKATMEFCRSRVLLCIDVTPALEKRAEQGEKVYFSADSHWNDAGNRIVAEEIYRQLAEKKML
ncbi:MAG TPA: GDSL-type esterase/lipase family protein [Methylomirabilota bacterium]|nr:GDSL-type esterase/lipase family protein [Methylomirabilota bacterium]